jgi:hypothetical protein
MKLCRCESGLERYELTDAAGIFCAYVCENCEAEEKKKWNPQIFRSPSAYAVYGDEDLIGYEEDAYPDDYEEYAEL